MINIAIIWNYPCALQVYTGSVGPILFWFIGFSIMYGALLHGLILFTILKKKKILRDLKIIEEEGMDVCEHGELIYN